MNITSLADLRKFTQSFPAEEYPMRDTALWDQTLQNWNNTSPNFWPAYQQNLFFGEEGGLLGALERHNLDAVILPAFFAADWAAMIGAPIVTVPLGSFPPGSPVIPSSWGMVKAAPNIPYVEFLDLWVRVGKKEELIYLWSRFGLSFLGAQFTEARLIGMAYAFEQRTMVREKVKPYLVPKTELVDVVGK